MTGMELLRECRATDAMIDWFWRFATMVTLNVPLERCSAASLLRLHSQLIGHEGIHFGFPAVGLSDLYVSQSVAAIESAGGLVRRNARVARTRREADGLLGARVENGDDYRAHRLVFAVPLAELLPLEPHAVVPGLRHEPSPYKSVYVWFDRAITSEHFWALLWQPDRVNYDFYDLANIRPAMAGGPSVIASNVIYSHRVASVSDEALVRTTVDEIALFAPAARSARVRHAVVHHIDMAIPCPLPGFETTRPASRSKVPGVYLAGDWTSTHLPCSMESAVRSGYLAAEALLEDAKQPRHLAIAPRPTDGIARWVRARAARRHGVQPDA
jgi:15-cis-phytoene desaturase